MEKILKIPLTNPIEIFIGSGASSDYLIENFRPIGHLQQILASDLCLNQ